MADPHMKTARGFSRLSGMYDRLAGLVYGRALRKAQTCMLGKMESGGEVLVLGGGTGWFLEALLKELRPERVVYVELSPGMMQRSQARIREACPQDVGKVTWQLGTVHDLPEGKSFDLVCTHCFLDLFEGEALRREVAAINARLLDKADWYFSDFRVAEKRGMRMLSKALIKVMYLFFRWCCGIQAGKLGDFEGEIKGCGMEVRERRRFFGGMIEAVWFQRGA